MHALLSHRLEKMPIPWTHEQQLLGQLEWAPGESSVMIDSVYVITHLQENPQRIGWGFWGVVYYIYTNPLVTKYPKGQGPECKR